MSRLDEAASDLIRILVRGGFEPEERIVEILCEEVFEPGELAKGDVVAAVARDLAAHMREQASWPEETDCDRLTVAFVNLSRRGVIAIENAGYTQSDGYEDVQAAYSDVSRKSDIIGYCFYHGQDLEQAVDGGGLYLAFGPMDADLETTEGPRVGKLVVAELEANGIKTAWNGAFNQRIHIPRIDWKRRRGASNEWDTSAS